MNLLIFHSKDNTIDVLDGSCDVIEITSNGEALKLVTRQGFVHNWLGKYYKMPSSHSQTEEKYTYRKIGWLEDFRGSHYHAALFYSEQLGHWGVISNCV